MVADVNDAGGVPILVTPLTRRNFDDGSDTVTENLKDQVVATQEVADENTVRIIDLNGSSEDYVNSIGEEDANAYNLDGTDRTHLNAAGQILFGNMVANLIATSTSLDLGEDTADYLAPNTKIVDAIDAGEFILPETS